MNEPVIPHHQLSRAALLWLLAGCAACVLLLSAYMPWWLLPVTALCLTWRLLIFQGRLAFPAKWQKTVLVLTVSLGLLLQFRGGVSLDLFVALLLLAFSLKLLEVYRRQDAQRLLYLAFFVLMTFFLFEQSLGFALLGLLMACFLVAALVAVNADTALLAAAHGMPLWRSLVLFGMALPLMAAMFIVMPRLPPLWTMPLQKQQQAMTGMSDEMSPGDIAELANSSALAFRATFAKAVPAQRELYWRGMVLDSFDGKTWRHHCPACAEGWRRSDQSASAIQSSNGNVRDQYQIIVEPHGRHWLFMLSPSQLNDVGVWMHAGDQVFRRLKVLDERDSYDVVWLDTTQTSSPLTHTERQRYLALPQEGNVQARALAEQWRSESTDARQVMQRALELFRRDFHYSMQPPLLGDDRVDDFLFRTRRGFCEHFAGSFTFLMRAAGIPARVVTGYMGGEVNAAERYVIVRQLDAHAWAEVWLPDMGWVRVDPTAAVAPDRIERSLLETMANIDGANVPFYYSSWLSAVRLQMEHMDYLWARWVLGYEGENQRSLLHQLGLLSPWRLALWSVGITLFLFCTLGLYLLWRARRASTEHPVTRQYRALCAIYARWGVERANHDTPWQFAARVQQAGLPQAEQFFRVSNAYALALYGAGGLSRLPREYPVAMRRLRVTLFFSRLTK